MQRRRRCSARRTREQHGRQAAARCPDKGETYVQRNAVQNEVLSKTDIESERASRSRVEGLLGVDEHERQARKVHRPEGSNGAGKTGRPSSARIGGAQRGRSRGKYETQVCAQRQGVRTWRPKAVAIHRADQPRESRASRSAPPASSVVTTAERPF